MAEIIESPNQLSKEYLPAIEEALLHGVRLANREVLGGMQQMIAYHMGWEGEGAGPEARGKRIRPHLVLFSCNAAGGNWKDALPAATAVELIHNFSLIHDDIEDNSPLRRGRPTVWKLWGISQAINVGDAMLALAHLAILNLDFPADASIKLQAVQLLQKTCLSLTQGQYLDLSFENRNDISLDDYWEMIAGKTAALMSTCTQIGALIAGADEEKQSHYREFGRYLGLAFQVQDDLLGIWGQTELTGKSADSDLVNGKKSLPVIFGLVKKGKFAKRWHEGVIPLEDVPEIANLLAEEGAKTYCEQQSNILTQRAIDALVQIQPEAEGQQELLKIAERLLGRRL